ncbi:MAG: MoaD/ThiS family protein [Bryobacteraceae bacterium]
MATVFIPVLLQSLTGGAVSVEVTGESVRAVVEALEERFPGIAARLQEGERLRPNLAVAVDGEVSPLGLRARVGAASEVHFVAAIKGGCVNPTTGAYRISSKTYTEIGERLDLAGIWT